MYYYQHFITDTKDPRGFSLKLDHTKPTAFAKLILVADYNPAGFLKRLGKKLRCVVSVSKVPVKFVGGLCYEDLV